MKMTREEEVKQEEVVTDNNNLDRYPTAKSEGLHHDHIAAEALGGHVADLPNGYYRSPGFIGTVVVSSLSSLIYTCLSPNTFHRQPVLPKSPDI